ncbi:hypothetical protein HEK616_80050 (plasmid) [Streptomyces nigrescens]|uniref:DUF4232 domain-containing protein n=2 Tax=Streptomyces TaxID=1883 RepID=A0ABM8A796_STRNI|nr:hypothetical protein [Streptomyces nigrescens]MEE4418782.1 hypothetical protein [Streptomyces sp. DSM 41528]BDM74518.1 hypothetical protein HEK616_80050 [Streptomyces nigrescens]
MRRITRKFAVTAAVAALVGMAGGGAAQALSPTAAAVAAPGYHAPSACRPANHTAKITVGPATTGHRHYRVTLIAAPGYEPCRLAGSPTDVRFYHHGALNAVTAGQYGPQGAVVNFGPGHPVHFDIQVPYGAGGAPADEATFTLKAPDGVIPGESTAYGPLTVGAGTVIGPVRPGA